MIIKAKGQGPTAKGRIVKGDTGGFCSFVLCVLYFSLTQVYKVFILSRNIQNE